MSLSRRHITALVLAGGVLVGCSGPPPTSPESTALLDRPTTAAATAMRGGELGALTARGLVDALEKAGFAVPNRVDTTARDCPGAGCEQSITTDTLAAKSFSSTGRAQSYAADRGFFQVETVVIEFAPPVTPETRERYRAQIKAVMR
jgi:hypothetical protein